MATTSETTQNPQRAEARAKMDELAGRIKDQFRQANEASRTSIERHREAGKLLAEAHAIRDAAGRTWGKWVKKHFDFSQQHANILIRLDKEWAKVEPALKDNPAMTIKDALAIIRGKPTTNRPREKRTPITESLIREALQAARIKLSVPKVVQLLDKLGVKVKDDEDD